MFLIYQLLTGGASYKILKLCLNFLIGNFMADLEKTIFKEKINLSVKNLIN